MTTKNKIGEKNHLANEKSPYLLQHVFNPVDWYPWGEEAFAKAKKENKPIFLSIGYSTCHWCHVMAHESFEDEQVAQLLNETFICIKVDREERPDLDHLYMTVAQKMTGQGGWPLTVFLTPDKKPFHAATYIPKEKRFGMSGLMDLIPHINTLWKTKQKELEASAQTITDALQTIPEEQGSELTQKELEEAFQSLSQQFDSEYGGFGLAPKFPTPHNLTFLLRYHHQTQNKEALAMVEKTILTMRKSGVYDQVGFGFHRYSTDRFWKVPHFEKMLYDQALMIIACTETFQVTQRKKFQSIAEETIEYVLRDLTSKEGGFYSAEDADSEGKEGTFYVWTQKELQAVLSPDEFMFVQDTFTIEEKGNFIDEATQKETFENILHAEKEIDFALFEPIRKKLFTVREKRINVHKDDKILTDWNGLMIAALAKAGKAFNNESFLFAAEKAAQFILTQLKQSNGRLLHRFRDGESAITAHASDYSFFIWGLLELYEATFKVSYLETALALQNDFTAFFWDTKDGGFFLTPTDGEALLLRQKEWSDNAAPSSNSVALTNLIRLSKLTGDVAFEKQAQTLLQAVSFKVQHSSLGYTQLLQGLSFTLNPSFEIVIAENENPKETGALLQALHTHFLPHAVILLHPNKNAEVIEKIAPFIVAQKSINGNPTVYVCSNYLCNLPVFTSKEMLALLSKKS